MAAALLTVLVLGAALSCGDSGSPAAEPAAGETQATQPPQPAEGPGGSGYPHRGWRVSEGGAGFDAWYTFEPAGPRPAAAPVAIVLHGYGEYAGYAQMHELIRHTVRTGTIVIYPRWQTGFVAPCRGPAGIGSCLASATAGIRGALAHLRHDPGRVRPDLTRASWFGFSFGGVIALNLAARHRELGLPAPRAMFLDDPHDGGVAGPGEPGVQDDLSGIPATTLLQCHSGADGIIGDPGKSGSSCNAIMPRLGHIPLANRDLLLTRSDGHGEPVLSSAHGVCAGRPGRADAYDWGFCWKVWDALRACAEGGRWCRDALGDTPERRSNGRWSDGVPVAPLTVRDRAPVGP